MFGFVCRINVVKRNLRSAVETLSNRRLEAIIGIHCNFLASNMNYEDTVGIEYEYNMVCALNCIVSQQKQTQAM